MEDRKGNGRSARPITILRYVTCISVSYTTIGDGRDTGQSRYIYQEISINSIGGFFKSILVFKANIISNHTSINLATLKPPLEFRLIDAHSTIQSILG